MKNLKKRLTAMASLCAFCLSMAGVPAAAEGTSLLGDSDMDGTVTAKDASLVLMFAATMGLSDAETIGEELGMDITVSDVNADGAIDAKDAGNILEYTSAVGTGFVGTMEIFMMEPTAKNFEYYLALSDYEVYKEYCEVYGFEAEETLPAEEDLPHYKFFDDYIITKSEENAENIIFDIVCESETAYNYGVEVVVQEPEQFGFPEDWQIIDFVYYTGNDYEIDGVSYAPVSLQFIFGYLDSAANPNVYMDEIVDMYRLRLTLLHSDFIKNYCQPGETVQYVVYL